MRDSEGPAVTHDRCDVGDHAALRTPELQYGEAGTDQGDQNPIRRCDASSREPAPRRCVDLVAPPHELGDAGPWRTHEFEVHMAGHHSLIVIQYP